MVRVYGIKNCDTVKKALKHLDREGVEYEFIDFKKNPPTKVEIKRWKEFLSGWPVNTRGRTYKQLQEEFEAASDAKKAELIMKNTSLIKRPVLEKSNRPLCFGYDTEVFDSL